MEVFSTFLKMGFDHISDLKGYDHLLFIITLCSIYSVIQWRQVAVLVTAFTIGHSVTLALSALKIIIPDSKLTEAIIPITIFITAIYNLYSDTSGEKKRYGFNYLIALLFGLIHGMAFSNFFNAIMGDSMDILFPLFAFNLGLEAGQLLIVVTFFTILFLLNKFQAIKQKSCITFISGAGAGISLIMLLERI